MTGKQDQSQLNSTAFGFTNFRKWSGHIESGNTFYVLAFYEISNLGVFQPRLPCDTLTS